MDEINFSNIKQGGCCSCFFIETIQKLTQMDMLMNSNFVAGTTEYLLFTYAKLHINQFMVTLVTELFEIHS